MIKASIALTALAVAGTALAPAAAAKSCMRVSGHGTGIVEPVAKYMSQAALKNGIAKRGLRPAGAIRTYCKTTPLIYSSCTSSQRAC